MSKLLPSLVVMAFFLSQNVLGDCGSLTKTELLVTTNDAEYIFDLTGNCVHDRDRESFIGGYVRNWRGVEYPVIEGTFTCTDFGDHLVLYVEVTDPEDPDGLGTILAFGSWVNRRDYVLDGEFCKLNSREESCNDKPTYPFVANPV